jgi:hypothetical protein
VIALACLSSSWRHHHLSIPTVEGFAMMMIPRILCTTTTRRTARVDASVSSRLYAASGDEKASNDEETNDDDAEEEDDDDDETIKPYGSRSLAWTKRYRRLIPYHVARAQAVAMGMSTQEDYQRWRRGPYQIQRPDEMYALEWSSWDEFLGAMRTYDETRQVVRLLQLQSMEEYQEFVRQDPKRAEGLRIPARPDIVYRDCGWENARLFFFGGTSDITNQED